MQKWYNMETIKNHALIWKIQELVFSFKSQKVTAPKSKFESQMKSQFFYFTNFSCYFCKVLMDELLRHLGIWLFRLCFFLNVPWQSWHWNGFSFSWTPFWWTWRCILLPKDLLHRGHWYGFNFWWTIEMCFISWNMWNAILMRNWILIYHFVFFYL